jgi:hypothetical protein
LYAFCGEGHPDIGVAWTGEARAARWPPRQGATSHDGAPRCLFGLFDAEATGLADCSEFGAEAERWGVEVRGLSREDLRALIISSTREVPTTEHRRMYQEASNFVWWGRRGGRRTLALYGRPYFSLLARFGWGRAPLEALTRHRAGSLKGAGRSDPPPRV